MTGRWTAADMPELHGRVAVVTGANSGIGLEATRALAAKGAHVILAVRSAERGQAAVRSIQDTAPNAAVEVVPLDLGSLESVRRFAEVVLQRFPTLDLLINNAGVMGVPFGRTADGFELQFGTNHLGHFALTGWLLPALLRSENARVVTVSSAAHLNARLDFGNLQGERGYRRWRAYGQSKLANLMFAFELQRRLAAAGAASISVACHPGWAATNLATKAVGDRKRVGRWLQGVFNLGAQSAAMGALPTLYAATAPGVPGGAYIGPAGFGGMRGYPGPARVSERARNTADAARLWEVSEQLTGVRYAWSTQMT
ncbi:MAG: SDR family oxidoreductase [Alicyclobacillus sp.]|nr:SDR family oxidoreductase [Alicyclobacillus sp.]